jgi:hypothetical protein
VYFRGHCGAVSWILAKGGSAAERVELCLTLTSTGWLGGSTFVSLLRCEEVETAGFGPHRKDRLELVDELWVSRQVSKSLGGVDDG